MGFALRLKELREKQGISQATLARELDIGTSTIAMWETGDRCPTALYLIRVAKYFAVTCDYLLGYNIKNRIRELREKNNITQTELARIVGVVRSAMCQYESGTRHIPDEIKIKLADYFNVSVDYILGRSQDIKDEYSALADQARLLNVPPEYLEQAIKTYGTYFGSKK